MSHKTTLLPCPFCGGEARLVNDYSSEKGMSYQIWHECTGHEGRSGGYGQGVKPFFETPWYATDAEAISAWNTRTDYHGYEQAAIEAWKSIKAWNTRATHGTLTAEQVREAIEETKAELLESCEYVGDMGQRKSDVLKAFDKMEQAIADELNAELGSECDKWKAKAEEAGRAMNAAVGLWAKADVENRELTNAINELQKKQPYCYAPEKPLDTLNTIGRYIDELKAERDEWKAKLADLNAELGSGTCEVECFDDGVDEGMDGEWFSYSPPTWYLSCGHTAQGTEKPNFCPVCGKAVKR